MDSAAAGGEDGPGCPQCRDEKVAVAVGFPSPSIPPETEPAPKPLRGQSPWAAPWKPLALGCPSCPALTLPAGDPGQGASQGRASAQPLGQVLGCVKS